MYGTTLISCCYCTKRNKSLSAQRSKAFVILSAYIFLRGQYFLYNESRKFKSLSILLLLQDDLRYPRSPVQDIIFSCLNKFVEPMLNLQPINKLREQALDNLMEHIHYEEETTNYICICPINKVMHKEAASPTLFVLS